MTLYVVIDSANRLIHIGTKSDCREIQKGGIGEGYKMLKAHDWQGYKDGLGIAKTLDWLPE